MNNQMVLFDVAYKAKQQEDAFVQECLKKYPQTSRFTAAFYHQAWQLGEEVSKANPFRMNTEYEMLGVERSATKREVYNAYRRKARKKLFSNYRTHTTNSSNSPQKRNRYHLTD